MSFFSDYVGDADTAGQQSSMWPGVILAQWADETGYGTSNAFVHGNNYAGVSGSGGVNYYPSKTAGLAAYIQTINLSYYNDVRAAYAIGPFEQMVQLGKSPWAGGHYDANGTGQPGIDLINIYNSNGLSAYDTGAPKGTGTQGPSGVPPININNAPLNIAFPTLAVGRPIPEIAFGVLSDLQTNNFFINGTNMDVALRNTLVVPQLDMSISQATTLTLTISDPDRVLINSDIFTTKSTISLGSSAQEVSGPSSFLDYLSPTAGMTFVVVSVDKQGSVLTVAAESYVTNTLRTAHGPITAAPGTMTRTDFAQMLVFQVIGSTFWSPPHSYLYAQDSGYARNTQEQLSRGTTTNPQEDSWTCLQRLASEIQFICFEVNGTVYFGNEFYLTSQQPIFSPSEGINGVMDINGTYDTGLTDGKLTINATAGTWFGYIGQCINVGGLGPFNGTWLISDIARNNLLEPEIEITCVQPSPSLPEPTSGGAQAAVGAGYTGGPSQQSQGGSQAAQQAVNYAKAQLGKPYITGGEDPATGFDCSGLTQAAYASAGVSIPRTSETQWGDQQIMHVPDGIRNLLSGDLVYFTGGGYSPPGHTAIISSINFGTNQVTVISANSPGKPIAYTTYGYIGGGGSTPFGAYFGAIRPAA